MLDYNPIAPIAPGVVLIKAPGHTPGSQMVYVRLRSGAEVILAGDVAWSMCGIDSQRQKPDSTTRSFGGEDRQAVATELPWLRDVQESQVTVVVSHDVAWIDKLIARGILTAGFDLSRR